MNCRAIFEFIDDHWFYFMWTAVMAMVIKQNGLNDVVLFVILMGAAAYLQGRKDAQRRTRRLIDVLLKRIFEDRQ